MTEILVLTGGHPFEPEPFFAVFDGLAAERGLSWTHVPQPEARERLNPDGVAGIDAVVLYDMPGITFTGSDPPAVFEAPSEELRHGYRAMLEAGVGLVYLHHAIASWPAWPELAQIIGGRFHYQPGELGGRSWPDSGYRFDVTHTVEVLDPDHPICAGLDPSFEIVDELYLFPVLTDDVVPLLRSSYDFEPANFYSADRAIRGDRNSRDGWTHPEGSDLVGWVKHAGRSPVAYIQFGDGPQTYADANYRRVVGNAITWAASSEAHRWARQRRSEAAG